MPESSLSYPARPGIRAFTKLVVLATVALIFLGGQVKSHEAGLAVPDWPTTYGQNMYAYPMADWVGGIFHEHVHRLVASFVGILCVILALWMGMREERPWARMLGVIALGLVILQGLLGGLTVILMLPAWTSVSHGVLAQSFFVFTIFIAYVMSRERRLRDAENGRVGHPGLLTPSLILFALVYLQLIAGALMRHTESGLALPDFPTMAGQWLPWFTQDSVAWVNARLTDHVFETGILHDEVTLAQLWIHLVHRVGAVLVLLSGIALLVRAWRMRSDAPGPFRTCVGIALILGVQIALGIATVLTMRTPVLASLHVVTGAALLGLVSLNAFRVLPLSLARRTQHLPEESNSAVDGAPQEA